MSGILKRLFLKNFRNYREEVIEFGPGVNLVYGINGQGKTTLLEAAHLFIAGRSFRTNQLAELVGRDDSFFHLEAHFTHCGVEQKLKFSCNGKERRIMHNNTPHSGWVNLLGLLRGVVMTPDDNGLIKGPPSVRRHFLDLQIAQVDPFYVHHLSRYKRAMKQRNLLLRNQEPLTIDLWESEMASSAAYIVLQRRLTVADLEIRASKLHPQLAGTVETLALRYPRHAEDSESALQEYYINLFQKNRPREWEAGVTVGGPHRDDLSILLNGFSAADFASEGQQRSCVAALKLAEWQRLSQRSETPPIMMIDDIGIGLDAQRRSHLLQQVSSLGQLFISSVEDVTSSFTMPVHALHIHAGRNMLHATCNA